MSQNFRNAKSLKQAPSDEWRARAVCNPNNTPEVDPMWQWHAKHRSKMLVLCVRCPVKRECLAEQKLLGADGVWGGRTFFPSRIGPVAE
jgi:hypothetical protein